MTLFPARWAYPETDATRDLRLDFMRGVVVPLLLISHFDYFSLYMYIGWERIGVVSTAEIFVLLSGIVVGMVYGKKMKKDGFDACFTALIRRSAQLYRLNVFVILVIGLMRYLPYLDMTSVTTFHNPYTGVDYPLYPPLKEGFFRLLSQALLLRCGPHQFQIIGLYVVLFSLITPLVFRLLEKDHAKLLLGASWILYFINFGMPESRPNAAEIRWTGAQFEYGFPTIAWQLLYVNGIVAGYYKKDVLAFFKSALGLRLIYASAVLSVLFIIFTLNHPVDEFASWTKFSFIPADQFNYLYFNYFQKYKLGVGRLTNIIVLFISMYALLSVCWKPFLRAFGWYLIPLGQASLYVFFVHVFLLLIVSNTPFPGYHDLWINTAIHTVVLAVVWLMVKTEFLFKWIPH